MYLKSVLKEEGETLYEIEVNDVPIKGSIIRCKDFKYSQLGKVDLEGRIHFSDGFFIVETNFNVYQESVNLLQKRGDYIQISLLLRGNIATYKSLFKKIKNIDAGLLQLVFRGDTDVEMKMAASKEPLNYIRMFFSKEYFINLLENEKWNKSWHFYNKVFNNEYVNFGENLIPVSHAFVEIISNILKNDLSGNVKSHYVEHKLRELFLQLFISLEENSNVPWNSNDTEIAKLETARAYLTTNYHNPPTIKQLSRIVSLNELKLKVGFKEKFNITIHDFITSVRMIKAQKMLSEKKIINEISEELGYKSTSHFITTFKKFYGVTPKQSTMNDFLNQSLSNTSVFVLSFMCNVFNDFILFT